MRNKKEIKFLQDLNKLIKKHKVELRAESCVDVGWVEVYGDIKIHFGDDVNSEIIENKIYMLEGC